MQPENTTKVTVTMDDEAYGRVRKKLHHGMISAFLRAVIESLDRKLQDGKINEVSHFINQTDPITLCIGKEKG